MNPHRIRQWAAAFGFLAVLLGAFGAHGLEERLTELNRVETWETAVFYHFIHALALFGLSLMPRPPKGAVLGFIIGIVIFSGSLYALSLTGITKLGAITPFGGLAMMVGWGCLFISKRGTEAESADH
jgi:uncharacterized membrane protein YgdD (TMEM256/DUF423 family)